MARSKPTRSINLTYKAYNQAPSEGPLYPCYIGPRYQLHKLGNGNTLVGTFKNELGIVVSAVVDKDTNEVIETGVLDNIAYPNKSTTVQTVVDQSSVKAYISNSYIQTLTSAAIASVEAPNCLVFASSVSLSDVNAGDLIELSSGEDFSVIDVRPIKNEASTTIQDSSNATTTLFSVKGFKGSDDVIYMLHVVSKTADSVTFSVASVTGDSYSNSMLAVTKNDTVLGGKGISIALSKDYNESTPLEVGAVFYVYGTPESYGDYKEVYVNGTPSFVTGLTADVYSDDFKNADLPLVSGLKGVNANSVAIDSAIQASVYDPVTNSYVARKVLKGDLHIEYRELITENANMIMWGNATDDSLSKFVGEISPDNPLAFMSYCAQLAGSSEHAVIATAGNTVEDYKAALDAAYKNETVFAPITYSQDSEVINYSISKQKVYNSAKVAQFKKLWIASNLEKREVIVDRSKDSGLPLLVKIDKNGQAIVLNCSLLSAGVRQGDLVVLSDTNVSYTITGVADTDTLYVDMDGKEEVNVYTRATIARVLSNDDYATLVGNAAASYDSPYINYVWADTPVCGEYGVQGTLYLVCTLAALRCVNAPHAPLTDVIIPGWTTGNKHNLTESQLDMMNEKGVWIVFNDTYGSTVTRHQLTTVQDGTIAEEDSAVSNACSIVRQLRSLLYRYRGNANVTNDLTAQLEVDLINAFEQIRNAAYPYTIGPQLIDYVINNISMDPNNASRIIVDVNLDVPEPLLDGNYTFNIL